MALTKFHIPSGSLPLRGLRKEHHSEADGGADEDRQFTSLRKKKNLEKSDTRANPAEISPQDNRRWHAEFDEYLPDVILKILGVQAERHLFARCAHQGGVRRARDRVDVWQPQIGHC